jgi:prepilin-type N-terminal cleavage/methylation domain-containing protein/prepilin-type processing-associated H-X9-DG protein
MKPAGNEKKLGRAFTLVELLVVISVIGLLMGILIPSLSKARATANRTYCMANLRQIGVAMRSYLDDNRDIFPVCCAEPWVITDTKNPEYTPPISKVLGKILKEPKVFICKADTKKKYYLMPGNTSYWYNGKTLTTFPPIQWTYGLGGITIGQYYLAQQGVKEKDIEVMSDFDSVHPGYTGTFRKRQGQKNYLYADWHVSNYLKQE